VHAARQPDDRLDDRGIDFLVADVADEGAVDFQLIEREAPQVAER
jgi:hypothetical protein